jgi:hypothetical protein
MRIKINKKIKLNQILRDEIEKKRIQTKYISIKSLSIKFDIISKQYDIFNFFTTSEKCFPSQNKMKTFS